jgi:superfamily II DNA or RNA helicase
MTITLRPYQEEAIAAVDDASARGVRRPLVTLPTGCGKTMVFSTIIKRRGGTALILAHRDELLKQAADKLRTVAPELAMSIGFVRGTSDDVHAPIVVASVQTLARDRRLRRLPKAYRTVVIDEAHHATAPSYQRVLGHVEEADLTVGFTATPERNDGSSLDDVFDEVVYGRSIIEMIAAGYLCDLRGVRVRLADLDLSTVKVSHGDYQAEQLGQAMREAHAPEQTALAIRKHAPERKSLVFCPTVELAAQTAEAMRHAGIPTAHLSGETHDDERAEILRDLQAGRLRAVANVDVLTEGYDDPSIDCVAIAAPTRSRIAYVQRVGRGIRLHPGKSDCLVLDLVGVTEDLTLQSLPVLFSLKREPRSGETVSQAVAREAAEAASDPAEALSAAELEARSTSEMVDLLGGRDSLHWVAVDQRWAISAGEDEYLVLDPFEGQWRVLLLRETGAKIIASGLDLGYAQGSAEESLRKRDGMRLAKSNAVWRTKEPSEGQIKYLRRLGVTAIPETAGQATDLLTERLARRLLVRLDRAVARMASEAEARAA